MATTFLEDASDRHNRLVAALAEFHAAGDPTDRVLGAFGLAISYDCSTEDGAMRVAATLHHADGAWIRSHVTVPYQDLSDLSDAIATARGMVIGGL